LAVAASPTVGKTYNASKIIAVVMIAFGSATGLAGGTTCVKVVLT
jgi:hypothetical protein